MKQVYDRFKNNELVVFAAVQTVFEGHGFNTKGKLAATQETYDLPVPMGYDALNRSPDLPIPVTMADYRTGGTPWVVIIDKNGTVAFNEFHIRVREAEALIIDLMSR